MNSEDRNSSSCWYHDLSIIRWIFVVFGILIMVFAGGCAAFFFSDYLDGRGGSYDDVFIIMVFSGPPFLIGLLLWWLAARVGRQGDQDEEQ